MSTFLEQQLCPVHDFTARRGCPAVTSSWKAFSGSSSFPLLEFQSSCLAAISWPIGGQVISGALSRPCIRHYRGYCIPLFQSAAYGSSGLDCVRVCMAVHCTVVGRLPIASRVFPPPLPPPPPPPSPHHLLRSFDVCGRMKRGGRACVMLLFTDGRAMGKNTKGENGKRRIGRASCWI
ncbi:hypothetical protein BC939DRAFT_204105 [Gamsiella multidivaricata]|uniref:uncharacterized protein n=1 Tax=Gamsiella multidivaricata TaxID=101098 RepID=UPI00221F31AC|nr:uncharacterized protein BC939DRAFT_204105 [Gamsiella multidivaricata]KAI7821507.1 hypothetical protein BC939DRAFT_204105 [Gamsiella multidivaricata]